MLQFQQTLNRLMHWQVCHTSYAMPATPCQLCHDSYVRQVMPCQLCKVPGGWMALWGCSKLNLNRDKKCDQIGSTYNIAAIWFRWRFATDLCHSLLTTLGRFHLWIIIWLCQQLSILQKSGALLIKSYNNSVSLKWKRVLINLVDVVW